MDLDVVYKCPKDLCWQHVKQVLPPQSIDISIFKSCLDLFVSKRTIWNTLSRLKPDGYLCVECEPENVSDIIRIVAEQGYKYLTSFFHSNSRLALYLWVYKNSTVKPTVPRLCRINTWEEDVPSILIQSTQFGSTALLIGDATLPFIPTIKNMGRYLVCMGGDDIYCQMAENEGMRIEII